MTVMQQYGLAPVSAHRITGLADIRTEHVINSTEIVGIEVEVENAVMITSALNRAWQRKEDGSLRNGGIELVTRPINASAAPVCLEYLMRHWLNQECCFSPRTSVHVHLNVQDIERPQVLDMVLIYTIFERLFYNFVGRGRHKNIYCVPLTECGLLPNLVDYGETRDMQWSKYTGLNTLPIRDIGTIEFRHMHGTMDVAKLCTWIGLICKLKEYVRKTNTKDIRSMISFMDEKFDYGSLLKDVFGQYADVLKYTGPQELTFLQAKQALIPFSRTRNIQQQYSRDSAFAKFKG